MIGVVLIVLIAVYVYKYYENVKRYPKGPTPLPLIGNLHQFDAHRMHYFLEAAQEKHGDVFTIWTPRPMVVLMSYAAIKEGLVTKGEDFAGRMGAHPDDLFMATDNGGVIFSEGDSWQEQRRVKTSVDECMAHLASIEDKGAVEFRWPLQILVANVVNQVLFGYHYAFNDCKRLMDYSDTFATQIETMRKSSLVLVLQQFPSLARLPVIGWFGRGQYRKNIERLLDHVREDVVKCMDTFREEEHPVSFVHAYMNRMGREDKLSMDQMVNVCSDFFLAGMETTSTTLRWAMLHMANNVNAQDKIRAEIHSVLGPDGEVTMADKTRMPYTVAAIAEVQRMANILPLNLVHKTTCETEVFGLGIPAGTLVMPQIYNVMRTGEVFLQSDEFRPERFLMEDGKTLNRAALDHVIPFSMGKRVCAGEGLARMELFIGLVSILQKYRLLPPRDAPLDMSPIEGSILLPKVNKLRMIAV
ncbi:hypothetical protein PRIPAC_84574 [Pristionchus pacificus]|uniref:Cytochrome P450 n=1 Tax=Pristionchus pacificus TaxID=54126 RepID=A0A2A6BVK8_PRIPA|nr:hypothetical protein PRIPAC_84574 [Pristionchus pacificus]|eukprot:PDM69813.1 cytochrome P450 [Pristionchus pacificus]